MKSRRRNPTPRAVSLLHPQRMTRLARATICPFRAWLHLILDRESIKRDSTGTPRVGDGSARWACHDGSWVCRWRPALRSAAGSGPEDQSGYVASILSRRTRLPGLMWDLDNTPLPVLYHPVCVGCVPGLERAGAWPLRVARLASSGSVTVCGGAVAGVRESYLGVARVSGGPVVRGGGRAGSDPGRRRCAGHGVFHRPGRQADQLLPGAGGAGGCVRGDHRVPVRFAQSGTSRVCRIRSWSSPRPGSWGCRDWCSCWMRTRSCCCRRCSCLIRCTGSGSGAGEAKGMEAVVTTEKSGNGRGRQGAAALRLSCIV